MTSTNGLHAPRYDPDWARVPPHVHTYPNPPMYFRQTPAEKYTCPEGKAEYQKWWSKWHYEHPEWREEHYRIDSRFPVMRRTEFNIGVTRPPYRLSTEKPHPEFLHQGTTISETKRALALNRTHWNGKDPYTYQFTNAMTSTQYKRPVTSVYGPMLREPVYGVRTMYNRHGFMPAQDFY